VLGAIVGGAVAYASINAYNVQNQAAANGG